MLICINRRSRSGLHVCFNCCANNRRGAFSSSAERGWSRTVVTARMVCHVNVPTTGLRTVSALKPKHCYRRRASRSTRRRCSPTRLLDGVAVQVSTAVHCCFHLRVSMGYMRARPPSSCAWAMLCPALRARPFTSQVFVVLGTIGLCMVLASGSALEFARTSVVGLRAGLWIGNCWRPPRRCLFRLLAILAVDVGSADDRRDAFPEAHAHASTPRSWPRDWAGLFAVDLALRWYMLPSFRRRQPYRWPRRHHRKHRGVGGHLLAVLPAAAGGSVGSPLGRIRSRSASTCSRRTGWHRVVQLGQLGRRDSHLLCVARGV